VAKLLRFYKQDEEKKKNPDKRRGFFAQKPTLRDQKQTLQVDEIKKAKQKERRRNENQPGSLF
jgi:hypothetical protein